MNELEAILSMMREVSVSAVFIYFFMAERKSHERTRAAYRDDLRATAGFGTLIRHPSPHKDTQPIPDMS